MWSITFILVHTSQQQEQTEHLRGTHLHGCQRELYYIDHKRQEKPKCDHLWLNPVSQGCITPLQNDSQSFHPRWEWLPVRHFLLWDRMIPSHLILWINDSWDKMTPLQDVMVASGSALGSSTVAKVAFCHLQDSLQELVPLLIQHICPKLWSH